MFKKSMSLILTGAMLTLVFAGINNGGASEKAGKIIPDITKTESSEQVTLTIWDTFVDGSLGQAQEDIIAAYQEAHPNVTVERVAKDGATLSETLKAAFMSGDAPDLVYYEAGIGTVGNYVKAGYYEDLASVYDEYGWKDNIMSACWEIPSADGYVWGVGNEMETMSLYINQAIFDELGLDVPESIEELTEDMAVIKDSGYQVLANTLDSQWYNNMNFIGTVLYAYMTQDEIQDCMNNDGSWDKESVRKAVNCIQDWLDKGYFPAHPEVDGDQEQMFFSGDYACWITGNWEVGNITEKVDFTTSIYPFPGSASCADGGSQVNFSGGAYLVYSGSEVKDTAYQFIDFSINNPDTAKIWAEVGGTMPPYMKEYDVELSPLSERVVELLGDETLQNTAGINMWLGTASFDFFSKAGQNLAVQSLDEASFIAEAESARLQDIETGLTKGAFKVK
ncbi:ABC transporter substrate-binding protein [Murimonas intestini]|uniref:Carbohydrate ABC transporter substrate-binding protein (CUT1 family) n=1 Tax=Murimonas intestini TaxID=1337051 RepID=A0AB73T862_9FIRM|nr:extracellular solute-binding protein [Murimonas intestini]MCR1839914.1 extracellular solute-binding protein [Murimonas intestini]MCR1866755.1 extracellular solute-binding protein [Murimonas intestini]MCR1883588.1 extracellular solute-binding protein [Murimonas intestini]